MSQAPSWGVPGFSYRKFLFLAIGIFVPRAYMVLDDSLLQVPPEPTLRLTRERLNRFNLVKKKRSSVSSRGDLRTCPKSQKALSRRKDRIQRQYQDTAEAAR
ncbi:hypothetical protein SLA2020_336350 [Shorea laevis]